jgi:hypothetical protein
VVAPVYRNADTLEPLVERLATALDGRDWTLRLVVDACPAGSAEVARRLADADDRVRVTELPVNGGQHAALARWLVDEADAGAWVCLDADLQDPPEAVPALLDRLACGDAGAVFAGRRGAYESWMRRLTGTAHRWVAARLTGLPADAGAFLAMDSAVRTAVVTEVLSGRAPSVVLAVARAGRPAVSVPVVRDVRPSGGSSWTASARVRQSVRSLVCAARVRRRAAAPAGRRPGR